MASVDFLVGENFTINSAGGSGIGFFSTGFGTSIAVGSYNDSTYVVDSTGTSFSQQVDNCKYTNTSGVISNSATTCHLLRLPNYLATLNIRFTHSSSVVLANTKLYAYDRSNINNNPSGATIKVAEIAHMGTSFTHNGSGSSIWQDLYGSGSVMTLIASPSTSGSRPNGSSSSSTQHDTYVAISVSPLTVGSKDQLSLFYSTEYL